MRIFYLIVAVLFAVSACATAQVPVELFNPCANMSEGWSCEQDEESGQVEYILDKDADPNQTPLDLNIPWDQAEIFKKRMTFGRYVDDGAGGVKKEIVDAEIDLLAAAPKKEEGMSTAGKVLIGTGIGAVVVGAVWLIVYAASDTTFVDQSGNEVQMR